MTFRLGIDLGGTSAKIALVNASRRIVAEVSVATAGRPNPAALAAQMAEACRQVSRGKKVGHLGIGVAGDIDSERGIVRVSPNLGWKNVPLKRLVERQLRLKVVIENDAKAGKPQ